MTQLLNAVRPAWSLLKQLMRELADEGAYERHLKRHGRSHSPDEWRRFSEARFKAKYQRPKCC
jgi:hypothetical protein